jgi:hypothetical protein
MAKPPKSPVDMLTEIGLALHGPDWQAPLARDLGMDRKNIQRWLSGHTELRATHGLFNDAIRLLRSRSAALAATAEVLEHWLKSSR